MKLLSLIPTKIPQILKYFKRVLWMALFPSCCAHFPLGNFVISSLEGVRKQSVFQRVDRQVHNQDCIYTLGKD